MVDIATPLASLNCKLEQGVDNLKSFIYLTNEYGVPSASYLDDFVQNFGHDIVTGQFRYSKLDGFWETVKKDCEKNKVQYKEVYGSLFYELVPKYLQVVTKGWSEEEKKDLISSENDRLDLLKDFISNFDKYISEGLDMQEVYLENTPELIKKDENGEEYIDIQHVKGVVNAHGRLYRNKVVVLKGSILRAEHNRNVGNRSEHRALERRKGIIDGTKLLEDVAFQSPSGAASFVWGKGVNGWTDHASWVNSKGQSIDYYRVKRYSENTQVQNKDVESVTEDQIVRGSSESLIVQHKEVNSTVEIKPVQAVNAVAKDDFVKKDSSMLTINWGSQILAYINNTPDLLKTDEHGKQYVNIHTKCDGNITYARLYADGTTVVPKGSILKKPYGTVLSSGYGFKLVEFYNRYTVKGKLINNISFKSTRVAASAVIGTNETGWNVWLNDNNDSIRVYKDPIKSPITVYKTPASVKFPKYRLKAQYSSKGSQSLIGRELVLDGKPFGMIIGDTRAKIDGKAYDLSTYIHLHKIDISRLNIFIASFLDAYELEED